MVSLDPHNPQGGHFEVPLWELGLGDDASVKVEDLVDDRQFVWSGKIQHWWFRPDERPYAVFRISV
jgi:starch synthase (maltosyl-transferring)